MTRWLDGTSEEVKIIEALRDNLKGLKREKGLISEPPHFRESTIYEIADYFKKNPDASPASIVKTIQELQPGMRVHLDYACAIKKYFLGWERKMMKISDINEIMEKHILPSLKTLRDSDMLPRKKNPTNPNAYKFESLIMSNSNSEGFRYQKMSYDESAFEKPPNIDDFVMAFEAYYMLVNELKTVNGTHKITEN